MWKPSVVAVSGCRLLVRQRQRTLFLAQQVHCCSAGRPFSSSIAANPNHSLVPNNDENNSDLPSKLIDFQVAAKIEGEESHIATVELRPGETLRAESGAMLFMTEGIVMDTKLSGASSAFSRMLTGQNLFLTDFRYEGTSGKGTVGLGTDFPSKILRFSLADHPDSTLICQKGAYMASNPNVNIEMEFTKSMTAGFFGGQGFVLQRLIGQGDVLVKGGGTVVKKDLREGDTLRVTAGSIVAFESTVQYDVQMMPGIKNAMFGGEGLFLTILKGPGSVWLQGMPPDRMIAEIARRVPGGGIGLGIPIGMGGTGGGGDAAGGAGADEAAAAAAGGGGDAAVAATDAVVEADRNATVASSGLPSSSDAAVDSDSPSALFGDAAPTEFAKPDASTSAANAESTEPTFYGDNFSSQQRSETSFDDEFSTAEFSTEEFSTDEFSTEEFSTDEFSTDDGNSDDGQLFDGTESSAAENAAEQGQSIFRALWGFFSGEDER